jgi:hypothetical protein
VSPHARTTACENGFAGPACRAPVTSREGVNNFPWQLNGTVHADDYNYYQFHLASADANPAGALTDLSGCTCW